MYKLALVCGSTTFNDKEYMRKKLKEVSKKEGCNLRIREGGAIGADMAAKMLCREEVWLRHERTFKPHYTGLFNRWDKKAPLRRNIKMLVTEPIPEIVVGFYDRVKTSGTAHTITNAKYRKIKTYEFYGI